MIKKKMKSSHRKTYLVMGYTASKKNEISLKISHWFSSKSSALRWIDKKQKEAKSKKLKFYYEIHYHQPNGEK